MASVDRTAYPRFKRTTSARELREAFTPTADEIAWAEEKTSTGRLPGRTRNWPIRWPGIP